MNIQTTIQKASPLLFKILILLPLVVFAASLFAAIPKADAAVGINQRLNFQGRLFNSAGAVIPDGDYNIEFKIVQDGDGCNPSSGTFPCGGSVQWTETRTGSSKVTVRNGYFSVELGSVASLPTTIWNQDTLWLTLNLGGTGSPAFDGEMKPMRRLSAAPYALNSQELGGLSKANFVQLAQGVQNDATTNSSIFLNKQGATGNILQLQKAASDVFVINNAGATAINTNSTTALTVQNTGNNAFGIDTTNIKVAVGLATSSASSRLSVAGQGAANGVTLGDGVAGSTNLYVSANDTLKTDDSLIVGTIGVGGTNLLCYDGTNKLSTCSAAPGAGSYIYNGTSLQTNANFTIQATNSTTNGTIGGIIRGAAGGQTVDLFQLQDNSGAILTAFNATGQLVFGPSGSQDTNLYRDSANVLRTNDALTVDGLLTGSLGVTVTGGDINLNNSAGAFATSINAGTSTGTTNIATTNLTAATQTVNIATGTSATSGGKVVNIATGTPGAGTSTAIAIGNGGTTTGTVGITIGSNGAAAHTTVIQGGNGAGAGSEAIRIQPAAAGAIAIGGTSQAGSIILGQSTLSNTINIGNNTIADANTGTINIGTSSTGATGKTVVTVGSTNDASSLTLRSGTGNLNLNPSGASNTGVVVKPGADSTAAFQVQNTAGNDILTVDSTNRQLYVRNATDNAVVSVTELVTSQDFTSANWTNCNNGTNWTGTSTTTTHVTGTVACIAAAGNFTVTAGATYQIQFTIGSNSTAANTVAATIGGVSAPGVGTNTTHTVVVTASSTAAFRFTPTTSFNGVISAVSVKQITLNTTALAVRDSSNATQLEIRASSNVTALGYQALQSNTSGGTENTAVGYQALQSNTTGDQNTATGYRSLQANSTGSNSTAVGYQALQSNTKGSQNAAFGHSALRLNTTGDYNTAIGYRALEANTNGLYNVALGATALAVNTTGSSNTAVGTEALLANTTGGQNSAVGTDVLKLNTTGNYNTALGYFGLASNVTGASNTALGYHAGFTNTGSNNVFVGFQAGDQDPNVATFITPASLQNATAIGYGAQVQASNSLVLGGIGTVASNLTPKVGIGTTIPTDLFSVSPNFYDANTAGTGGSSSTTVTGSSTTWQASGVQPGMEIIFADGTKRTINTVASDTSLTVNSAVTIANGTKYRIHNRAFYVTSTGSAQLRTSTDSTTAFQVQNAAGTSILNVDTTGLVIKVAGNATTFATLTVDNAHFKSTQTNPPTIGTPTNCGTSPAASVAANSTDSAGSFTITAGTGGGYTSCDTVLTFNKTYGAAPKSIIVSPKGSATASARQIYGSASSATTLTVKFGTNPAGDSESNQFYYWVVE